MRRLQKKRSPRQKKRMKWKFLVRNQLLSTIDVRPRSKMDILLEIQTSKESKRQQIYSGSLVRRIIGQKILMSLLHRLTLIMSQS
ncbi:hypothetical protein HanXRQr2_Chr07g0293311 [Helianthus annuus]|uniref:Uncharacterized protein n=1 Tax=Helianthus annuus TaxID=4232 RepID=A0A9K3NG89_HELAN|nr:hypothetical protein HanXRQr2_Chr07g0293311 [Helianthus annuus]KAJ0904590.1 hypothetical protein HanPSC8_Chr07g0284011 [Helianthus annuus]